MRDFNIFYEFSSGQMYEKSVLVVKPKKNRPVTDINYIDLFCLQFFLYAFIFIVEL